MTLNSHIVRLLSGVIIEINCVEVVIFNDFTLSLSSWHDKHIANQPNKREEVMRYFTVNWGCRVHFAAALIFRRNLYPFPLRSLMFSLSEHIQISSSFSRWLREWKFKSSRRRWHQREAQRTCLIPFCHLQVNLSFYLQRRVTSFNFRVEIARILPKKKTVPKVLCDIAGELSLKIVFDDAGDQRGKSNF